MTFNERSAYCLSYAEQKQMLKADGAANIKSAGQRNDGWQPRGSWQNDKVTAKINWISIWILDLIAFLLKSAVVISCVTRMIAEKRLLDEI